jgi:hypothetical protein
LWAKRRVVLRRPACADTSHSTGIAVAVEGDCPNSSFGPLFRCVRSAPNSHGLAIVAKLALNIEVALVSLAMPFAWHYPGILIDLRSEQFYWAASRLRPAASCDSTFVGSRKPAQAARENS